MSSQKYEPAYMWRILRWHSGKESACKCRRCKGCRFIPGLGRYPGVENATCHFLFFLNLFIYFNWRLISLQYCSGFCHTLTWISHGCTCVPHPEHPSQLPPHPSGSSQCTGPERPVSCIEPGLAICFTYGNIRVSMLAILSNHPTLTFSHRVQKSVLYICVSFAVSHIGSLLPSF